MAPFYGWGSTASRLEPLLGDSLLFTTKFTKTPGAQRYDTHWDAKSGSLTFFTEFLYGRTCDIMPFIYIMAFLCNIGSTVVSFCPALLWKSNIFYW